MAGTARVVAFGVDVGATVHDVVVLDGVRTTVAVVRIAGPDELVDLLDAHRPDVVGIDGPPAFSRRPEGRVAERLLASRGIRAFPCPHRDRAQHPFFDWMRSSIALFDAASRAGWPPATHPPVARRSIEAYPHGAAFVLGGPPPPAARRSSPARREWRRGVLARAGVEVTPLRTLHQVDAALAALVAALAADGRAEAVGEPDDGVVWLPHRDQATV